MKIYVDIFGSIILAWVILGGIWALKYHASSSFNYKTSTIIIGGPIWWILSLVDRLEKNKEKIKHMLRPRRKEENNDSEMSKGR